MLIMGPSFVVEENNETEHVKRVESLIDSYTRDIICRGGLRPVQKHILGRFVIYLGIFYISIVVGMVLQFQSILGIKGKKKHFNISKGAENKTSVSEITLAINFGIHVYPLLTV